MRTLKQTFPTLPVMVEGFVRATLQGARENFARDGHLAPVAFFQKPGHQSIEVLPVPGDMGPEDKPKIWAGLRVLREHCPLAAFINEVWMVRGDKEHPVNLNVPPSQSPHREEKVLFNLWLGRRSITLLAEIKRNPNALGEWEVMMDSNFPEGVDQVAGAMAEGNPYTRGGELI